MKVLILVIFAKLVKNDIESLGEFHKEIFKRNGGEAFL